MKSNQTSIKKNLSEISVSRETTINKPQIKIAKKLSEISIIRKIGIEFIGAFLGVLIALFASNWRDNYKQDKFIESVIQSIYLNNQENNEKVKIQTVHLRKQIDIVNLYLKDEQLTLLKLIKKNNGLQTNMMSFTGWTVLGRSKLISEIDYELISTLTNNNDQYDVFRKKLEFVMGLLYEKPSSTLNEDKIRLLLGFNDLENSSEILEEETVKIDSLLKVKYPKLITDFTGVQGQIVEKGLAAQ